MRLPFNLGIGGAVQTGFRYALERGYELAVRLDGDGQHDPAELPKLLEPVERGEADIVTGSRFARRDGELPAAARAADRDHVVRAARLAAHAASASPTRRPASRRSTGAAIALFARDYPSDYPEVEATVLVLKHRLRLVEVPVRMREREHGSSSITFVRSIYYMLKVTLALLVAMARRYAVPVGGGAPVTPVRISIAAAIALGAAAPHRPRADPRPTAEGALRAALARDRARAARALGLARRPQHDRGLARRGRLPDRRSCSPPRSCSSSPCCCTTRRCSRG